MTKVRELMSIDVVTVTPDLSLWEVVDVFATRHIGGAPAAEPARPEWELEPPEEWREGDEAPAAFFSDLWPDAGADVLERFEQTGSPEWDLLREHTVVEVMSRRMAAVGPETAVQAAARLMTGLQIHRLLVLEQGKLLGVLSASDIVRAVGQAGV